MALAVLKGWGQEAAAEEHPVRTIFVAAAGGQAGQPDTVRRRVVERLERADGVRVVKQEASADAVLRVDAVIWPSGAVSLNPRSGTVDVRNYAGYASAELVGRSQPGAGQTAQGAPLWSYLATPGRFRFASISDDLGDQLGAALVAALRAGISVAPSASTGSGTATGSGAATGLAAAALSSTPLRVAGATFPAPLYARWFESFRAQGGAAMTYEAIGSSRGVEQLLQGKIDMAASDIPAGNDAATESVVRLPTVVGGVVPIYNLPGLGGVLNLTPEVLAGIFSGTIARWDDPRIRADNKRLRLPSAPIAVVHRSDGSGTTFVWTSFLAVTPVWTLGAGDTVAWPVGMGVAGSLGLATAVQRTRNAIGYVELTFAIQHQLEYGAVRNPAGRFVRATLFGISQAAQARNAGRGLLLNQPGDGTYPVASFTSFLLPQAGPDAPTRRALVEFLRWMLTSGQKQCSSLGYAPLPKEMVAAELKELESLR